MYTAAAIRRRAAIAVAASLAGFGALWLIGARAQAIKAPPRDPTAAVVVTTTTVQRQEVPIYRAGVGTVTPAQTVTVKARVDGQLDEVAFTEGQDVKAGQVLARIDPRTLQAQLAQSLAQRARDEAQLGNARADLQRYTTLIAQDSATQQQVDTQKALVAQLEAALKTDDAQIAYARVQLGFTTITAPISGRVGARLVDRGNIVHAADAGGLVVINQIDPITVVFTLPEDAVPQVIAAQRESHSPLAVKAYARDGEQLLAQGQLVLLNNQIDTATGTVQLKARFANASHALWPGQYVNVRLVLGRRAQALTVPANVVQRNQRGTYAYVVDADDTARVQPIVVAGLQDGLAIIDKGLAAGQRVVLDGQYKLKPGALVVASSAPAASGPAR